jgi:hypothetical protein
LMGKHVQPLMLPLHSANLVCHGQCVLVAWMHLISPILQCTGATNICWAASNILVLVFRQYSHIIFTTKGVSEIYRHVLHMSKMYHLILLFVTALLPEITPWPLIRKRTVPTERPPLVDEIFFSLSLY